MKNLILISSLHIFSVSLQGFSSFVTVATTDDPFFDAKAAIKRVTSNGFNKGFRSKTLTCLCIPGWETFRLWFWGYGYEAGGRGFTGRTRHSRRSSKTDLNMFA